MPLSKLTSSLVNGTTTTYTYDGNGNQLTGAGRTFSINDKNQMTPRRNMLGLPHFDTVGELPTPYTAEAAK